MQIVPNKVLIHKFILILNSRKSTKVFMRNCVKSFNKNTISLEKKNFNFFPFSRQKKLLSCKAKKKLCKNRFLLPYLSLLTLSCENKTTINKNAK